MPDEMGSSMHEANGPVDPLALDVAWLQATGLSNELQAQRDRKDGLRTRSIALFSAGAVVFGLVQARSTSQLDGWLLASLVALVTMGLGVAYILLPTKAFGTPDSDLDYFQTGAEYWDWYIERFRGNVKKNKRWENRVWLLHSAVACLLLVEASLIAAHFSSTGFRVAIVVLTSVGLLGFVFGPLGTALEVVRETSPTPTSTLWTTLERVGVIRGLPPE